LEINRSESHSVNLPERFQGTGGKTGGTESKKKKIQRKDTAFQSLVEKVYAAVAGQSKPKEEALGTQSGQPGATRALPNSQLAALAGLLEKLVEEGARVDLYRIGGDLVLELDDLLPIVEAGTY